MKNTIRAALNYTVLTLIVLAAIGTTSIFLTFNKRLVGGQQMEALIAEWDHVLTGSTNK
jgi:hypothetical protein